MEQRGDSKTNLPSAVEDDAVVFLRCDVDATRSLPRTGWFSSTDFPDSPFLLRDAFSAFVPRNCGSAGFLSQIEIPSQGIDVLLRHPLRILSSRDRVEDPEDLVLAEAELLVLKIDPPGDIHDGIRIGVRLSFLRLAFD